MYLKPWKPVETTLITESNDVTANVTLPTYPTSTLPINPMLIFSFNKCLLYVGFSVQVCFLDFNHINYFNNLLQSSVSMFSLKKRVVKSLV